VNVYDFDHTIYGGDSSVDFFLFALGKKPYLIILTPFQAVGILLYLLGFISKEKMKEFFFVFLGFIPAQETAVRFWEKNRRKIRQWYVRQKRDDDVIVSASPEFLLEPVVCGFLGVSLIASRIDAQTGKYTGKNCYGKEKPARFSAAYPDAVIDNFYSDSTSDDPLAEKARRSFMVKGKRIVPRQAYKPAFFEKRKKER
jgi:phosphoserine phosphatase